MAHRVNSRQRSTSVAFGAKRTLPEPRLRDADYEYTPEAGSRIVMSCMQPVAP